MTTEQASLFKAISVPTVTACRTILSSKNGSNIIIMYATKAYKKRREIFGVYGVLTIP